MLLRVAIAVAAGLGAVGAPVCVAAAADDDPAASFADATLAAAGARAVARVGVPAQLPRGYPRGTPRAFQPIEDPSGKALTHFFAALARTDAAVPGALTRVVHMGDSSIGHDGLPHAIRSRLQARFGDGGPGFVLLTRYSPNYGSEVAEFSERGNWDVCYIAYRCRRDGHYGLGGHVFRGGVGASATIRFPARAGGGPPTHFELWYASSARGGRARVFVDGQPRARIDSRGTTTASRWAALDVPGGGERFTVRVAGGQYVWAYGVVAETDGPGVVWDTMSMIGAYTHRIGAFDDGHIAEQLAHRDPNLLVLNFGGNDLRRLVRGQATAAQIGDETRALVAELRGGKPAMSCLVVGVVDHGRSGRHRVGRRHVEAMVAAQRRAAFDAGCAFFDTVAAMGGAGSIRKWERRRPQLAAPDLKHLNRAGRALIGARMVAALVAAYEAHATDSPSLR